MKKSNSGNMVDLFRKLRAFRNETKKKLIKYVKRENTNYFIDFFKYPNALNNPIFLSTKWLYGGFIIDVGNLVILVDPGAELLSRIKDPQELLKANVLFISHAHIDHYASANVALEFMKLSGKGREIKILAGKSVFDNKNISDYHLSSKNNLITEKIQLNKNKVYSLDNNLLSVVEMKHSIEDTFGFVLRTKDKVIGYIPDTGYSISFKTTEGLIYESGSDNYKGEFTKIVKKYEYIKKSFKNVDILVAHINDLYYNKHSKYHLSGFDLIDILKGSKIKLCIIPNLFPKDLLNMSHAKKVARYISKETGIKTITIPSSGLRINIQEIEYGAIFGT